MITKTKSLLVLAALLLTASSAHAEKRSFRINAESANDGYAVAWGFAHKKVNFEKLDRYSDNEIAKICKKRGYALKNYIVQLETNTVLEVYGGTGKTLTPARLDGRLGTEEFSSQFGLSVVPAYAVGLPQGQKVLFVLEANDRVKTVSEMLIVNESETKPAKVVGKSLAFNGMFDRELSRALPAAVLAQYRRTNGFEIALSKNFDNPFELIDFRVTASDSRTENVIDFTGTLELTFTNGQPSLRILSLNTPSA